MSWFWDSFSDRFGAVLRSFFDGSLAGRFGTVFMADFWWFDGGVLMLFQLDFSGLVLTAGFNGGFGAANSILLWCSISLQE